VKPGQVILFPFPHTDQSRPKLRPALAIKALPSSYGDWLICMITSQLNHQIPEFDEVIDENDEDIVSTGLKVKSLVRIARLAVVEEQLLVGSIGEVSEERLKRIRKRLADWILD
jgi:mRNA interferase MazF